MNIVVTTPEAVKGLYPTPVPLAKTLLEGIDWKGINTVLEPSCGKGNLVHGVLAAFFDTHASQRYLRDRDRLEIDGVEIDPALRAMCIAELGEDATDAMSHRRYDLERKQSSWNYWLKRQSEEPDYVARHPEMKPDEFTAADELELAEVTALHDIRRNGDFHMVGDDFLRFRTGKKYDLIVMNPPFANGCDHLLKAISMQERYGGLVCCILNAETLLNPYSVGRKTLMAQLNKYNADIRYMENAFSDAERKTGVKVALVQVAIPEPELKSDIFDRLTRAEEVEAQEAATPTDLALNDLVSRMVSQFNVEVSAGVELIKAYKALAPHILEDFPESKDGIYNEPILTLKVDDRSDLDVNRYVERVRYKYWKGLFKNKELMSRMTWKMQEAWTSRISDMKAYDFSVSNIKAILAEMNVQLADGVKSAIMELFEKFTTEHSWYPECSNNVHYYTGWSTNKAHYVNKKVIMPCGAYVRDDIWNDDKFSPSAALGVLNDVEKVLDYFAGEGVGASVDLSSVMNAVSGNRCHGLNHPPKNLVCKHFTVTFFKKGTVHITFHDQELVDRFNIWCARQGNELPPNYGKVGYNDLSAKEKAVVDSFNGDGTDGSGEANYTKVYKHQDRYLVQPKQHYQALPGGED